MADQAVQWLGELTAARKVPGLNPSKGINVKFSILGPISGCVDLRTKTGTREVLGSIPGRACPPSRSEFPMVFSETRVNTG